MALTALMSLASFATTMDERRKAGGAAPRVESIATPIGDRAPAAPPRPKRNALQLGFVSIAKTLSEQLRMSQFVRVFASKRKGVVPFWWPANDYQQFTVGT